MKQNLQNYKSSKKKLNKKGFLLLAPQAGVSSSQRWKGL